MIVPGTLTPLSPVFISFSSKDVKLATTICQAIESRGATCWISNRDVKGGENFQEAIIKAIHDAKIMVLVFSSNTNNSGEIKKELALASQNGLVVIPVRVEDVMPSGAFAYELSTRQWIDLFQDWELAMEGLTSRIAAVLGAPELPIQPLKPAKNDAADKTQTVPPKRSLMPIILAALAAIGALSGASFYYWQRTCCAPPPHGQDIVGRDDATWHDAQQNKNVPPNRDPDRKSDTGKPSEKPAQPSEKLAQQDEKPAKPDEKPAQQDEKQAAPSREASMEREVHPSNDQNKAGVAAASTKDKSSAPQDNQSSQAGTNLAALESKPQVEIDPSKPPQEDEAKRKAHTQDKTAPIALGPPKLSDIGDGGEVFRECDNCPAMVVIPAGKIRIGSASNQSGHDSSEEPRREVQFKQAFAVGRDAVSYAEWDACVAEGGCNHFIPGDMGWGRGQQPVVLVSWEDAKAYTTWLSQKTGATYRLPYEAEWEYAARGCRLAVCQDQIFWFGNQISPDRANYDWRYSYAGSQKAQTLGKPKPAGTFGPNPFGLFNAIGNVAQWVEDCWNDNLKSMPADGVARQSGDCSSRVFRGGSWHDEPIDLRSASRKTDLSNSRQPSIGFRVARVLD